MKKLLIIWILMALCVVGLSAADRQFYLVGKYARLGSISSEAKTEQGIYLRWDIIEGNMPTEIDTMTLVRVEDNSSETTLLDKVAALDTMDSMEIQHVFASRGSERRLVEAIDMISQNNSEKCSDAHLSNIGSKVKSCMQNDLWSFMASRVNFDIARSRYRAYLDTDFETTKPSITYKLYGHDVTANTVLLGKVEVPLSNKSIMAAKNFSQILESKCNDGRYALDDFRLALKWSNGGDQTDQFANNIMVSGYDLYYTVQPIENPINNPFSKIEIAKEAAKLSYDSQGNVDLTAIGIKKANDTLITLGAQAGEEGKPVYVEDVAQLEARGFKPGEKHFYYLVPRDFTGNYGPTVPLLVTIPDMLPPPMPFNPRVVEEVSQSRDILSRNGTLMWDAITPSGYAKYYAGSMKPCPGTVYNTDKRVRFVDKKSSCAAENGLIVNFNIKQYNVYRFDNIQEAAAFKDSDMDGYGDKVEKEQTESGVCDSSIAPRDDRYNHLVYTINAEDAGKVIQFKDEGLSTGKVYWYRIAAIAEGVSAERVSIASPMTAPVRAFVPKRDLLPAPKLTVKGGQRIWTELNTSAALEALAWDATHEENIDAVTLRMGNQEYELTKNGKEFFMPDGVLPVTISTSDTWIWVSFYREGALAKRGIYRLYDVFNTRGISLDDDTKAFEVTSRKQTVVLKEQTSPLKNGGIILAHRGEDVCLELDFDAVYYRALTRHKGTIEVSRQIGDRRYPVSKIKTPQPKQKLCTDMGKNGDLLSYRLIECRDNGICSNPTIISVVVADEASAPNPPTLISVETSEDKVRVHYRPQLEKTKSTMLYLYKESNESETYTEISPHIGDTSMKQKTVDFDVSSIVAGETWCVKAKTVGLNGILSAWSPPLCQIQEAAKGMLAWPAIENRVTQQAKSYEVARYEKKIHISLGYLGKVGSTEDAVQSDCSLLPAVNAVSNFVVYRQTIGEGESSKFVQVSPLIEAATCSKTDGIDMSNNLKFVGSDKDGYTIVFEDRYPYVLGERYRYVLLFFDPSSKEPKHYSLTSPEIINSSETE